MIYLISDWHFCHQRDFIYKPRGFNSPEEMNATIIERHNAIVKPEDDVYCLGDCIMNNNEEGIKCINQLNGKIHIICGNHDTKTKIELYKKCKNIVEVCDAKWLKVNGQMYFLSHYPCLTDNQDADKPLSRKVINLCGHLHTLDKWIDWNKGLIYHVDCDAQHCTPIEINKIKEEIKNKLA